MFFPWTVKQKLENSYIYHGGPWLTSHVYKNKRCFTSITLSNITIMKMDLTCLSATTSLASKASNNITLGNVGIFLSHDASNSLLNKKKSTLGLFNPHLMETQGLLSSSVTFLETAHKRTRWLIFTVISWVFFIRFLNIM